MIRFASLAAAALGLLAAAGRADDSPTAIFQKRILPIFQSPNPSSCVQCHLAGVDLKDYIRPGAEETFRSLRDQGLIDLSAPEKSKILALIAMGTNEPGTPAVHAANRKAEYNAFAAWIQASAADARLRASPALPATDLARPARPDAVIRHGRTDRLLASFEKTVWAMRFRCMNCHTEGTPQNDKHVKEYGPKVAWVKKSGAKATMEYLIASRLIDPADPAKSLLLQKPLGAVKHEGGIKFAPGDQGYKAFRQWIEDVAAVRGGKYVRTSDLPPPDAGPLRFGTEAWLKLTNTPPAWGDRLLQVDVYAWDAAAAAWEAKPIATSDRMVSGKGNIWQHTVTLQAEPGSERAKAWSSGKPKLPPGRYLLKVYVDERKRLKSDWTATLGEADHVGEVEIRGAWREGYGSMTVADAGRVKK